MGEIVIRLEPDDDVDPSRLASELTELLPALRGTSDDPALTAIVAADFEDRSERLDPVTIAGAVAGVTLVLKGLTLTVEQARQLLDRLADLIRSADGVKRAFLEIKGKQVDIKNESASEISAHDLVAEVTS